MPTILDSIRQGLLGLLLLSSLSFPSALYAGGIGGRVDGPLSSPVPFEEMELFDAGGNFISFVNTDATGTYLFPGLADGTYYVRSFVFANLLDEWFNNVTANSFDPLLDAATPIAISGNATNLNVNFSLTQGAQIIGRVSDAGNQAVSNMIVRAVETSSGLTYEALTSALGQYTINQLPAGSHHVRSDNQIGLIDEWYNNQTVLTGDGSSDGATAINLLPGATQLNINFQLATGGAVSGAVKDQSGNPVTNLTVRVTMLDGTILGSGLTDASGAYTVNGLPTGGWYLRTAVDTQLLIDEWFSDTVVVSGNPATDGADAVSIQAGFLTPGVDFALDPSGSISGTINDFNGQVMPSTGVELRSTAGALIKSTSSDAQGAFTFSGLADGDYALRSAANDPALAEVWYNQVTLFTGLPITDGAELITISLANQVTNAELKLMEAGRISGSVTQSPFGGAVSDGQVVAYTADGRLVAIAELNAAGNYGITSLPPASYTVRSVDTGLLDEWYDDRVATGNDPAADAADSFAVTAGNTASGIDLELDVGGQISGRVTDGLAAAISGVSVFVTYDNGVIIQSTTTSGTGAYTLDVLPNGTLYVRTSNNLGFLDEWYDDVMRASTDPIADGATGITVGGGLAGPSVDFQLDEGGRIEGRVSGPGHVALGGVDVDVFDTSGTFVRGSTTAADGSYTVIALPAGNYHVNTFDPTLSFFDEWFDDVLFTSLNPAIDQPDHVAVTLGNASTGIDFKLEPPASINGVVFDAETNLVDRVPVEIRLDDGSLVATVVSDAAGAYSFPRVVAGGYHLRSGVYDKHPLRDAWLGGSLVVANDPMNEGSTPVTVVAGEIISDADMMLPIQKGLFFEVDGDTGFLDLVVLAGDTYRIMRAADMSIPLPWPDAPNGSGAGEQSTIMSSTNGMVTYVDPSVADHATGVYGYERMFSFYDDMEDGINGWTVDHGAGLAVDWLQTTQQACSGSVSWFATNTAASSELNLVSPALALGPDPTLVFWHWFDTERGFDGGRVEISSNGTAGPWADLGASMSLNGYNLPSMNDGSLFAGRPAFSGNSGGFIRTEVDLSAFANQTVHIRFRMASDAVEKVSGWFVDDVQLR